MLGTYEGRHVLMRLTVYHFNGLVQLTVKTREVYLTGGRFSYFWNQLTAHCN